MLSLQTDQKKTIRSLNPFFMIGLFFLFLLIRTSSASVLPGFLLRWDFLLPFVIYFGQRRPLFEGLLLCFIMSHWYSLESAAPIGCLVIFYLLIYLLSRILSETVFAADSFQILALLFSLGLLSRFILPWISHFFGAGWDVFSWRNLNLFFLISDLLLNFGTFYLLLGVDKVSAKEARPILDLNEGIL